MLFQIKTIIIILGLLHGSFSQFSVLLFHIGFVFSGCGCHATGRSFAKKPCYLNKPTRMQWTDWLMLNGMKVSVSSKKPRYRIYQLAYSF